MNPINSIIDKFARSPNPTTMDVVISAFRSPELLDENIGHLANHLALSGKMLRYSASSIRADVPSTGAPSSLSTLLCPLFLVSGDVTVPKLGVPGRPAGGIDVVACIPNFKINLVPDEINNCLSSCGYAHFLAGQEFTPLDATLFSYRQQLGAQGVGGLAIASLLSKKLAVGVTQVTLDVRVAPWANFGSWDVARKNSQRFVNVARQLGIKAKCILTDANVPYQNFIGRGESLVALHKVLLGTATGDLLSHTLLCKTMSETCLDRSIQVTSGHLLEVFRDHLECQGSNWNCFQTKVENVISQPTSYITASHDGYVELDLNSLRRNLTQKQEQHKTAINPFPDPCGIVLNFVNGEKVYRGAVIAHVRATERPDLIANSLEACFHLLERPTLRRDPETIH